MKKRRKKFGQFPFSPREVCRAVAGSRANRSLIRRRLGNMPVKQFNRMIFHPHPRWDRVRLALEREREAAFSEGEDRIVALMRQGDHLPTALGATKFVLECRYSERWGQKSTLTLEGGQKPLTTESRVVLGPAELAAIPVEARRELLARIQAQDAKSGAQKAQTGQPPASDPADGPVRDDGGKKKRRKGEK